MDPVLTLTMNPTIDVGLSVERLVPGRKLRSETARRDPGGGGINVARGLQRLGGDVCALFTGDDTYGARLEGLLGEQSVPCRRIPVRGATREGISVWVENDEELFHFVMPGPALEEDEVEAVIEAILEREPAPGWLVASGSLPPGVNDGFYARLARAAGDRGIRLVLDSHGAPLERAIEEPVFLIKPNRREFAELVGRDPADAAETRDLARRLVDGSALEALVITLGADGAILTAAGEQLHMRAPRVQPQSPVGAGDSFLAACVYELASGGSPAEALRSGVAGAAAAVKTPGTELFDVGDYRRIRDETRTVTEPERSETS